MSQAKTRTRIKRTYYSSNVYLYESQTGTLLIEYKGKIYSGFEHSDTNFSIDARSAPLWAQDFPPAQVGDPEDFGIGDCIDPDHPSLVAVFDADFNKVIPFTQRMSPLSKDYVLL